MKRPALALSIASVSLALLSAPLFAQSSYQNSPQTWQSTNGQPRGHREATHMVPARATLSHTLDARRTSDGFQFRARIAHKVQLDNGQWLPEGTVLLGQVAADDMNMSGNSKLALRFTQALLRNGRQIPIKATIVGIYSPSAFLAEGDYNEQLPNLWTPHTLQVDQIGVLSGVDLHSRIASRNSGVLVTTRKDDVEVPSGSEFTLAIAPANDAGNMNHAGE